MQCMSRMKSGVLSVVINPGITSREIDGRFYIESIRKTVTVVAAYEVLTKRFIRLCGFCSFEEADLVWAVPMGLAKVDRRPLRFGDKVDLSMFVEDESMQLTCIEDPSVNYGSRETLYCTAVFGVVNDDAMKMLRNEVMMSAARRMLANGEVKFVDVNRPVKKDKPQCR